jgi:hypothetical protein
VFVNNSVHCQLGLTRVVKRKSSYPPNPSSNPSYDMFPLRETMLIEALCELIIDQGRQGTSNLILSYRLEGGHLET